MHDNYIVMIADYISMLATNETHFNQSENCKMLVRE